jgi:membrane protease YdiL (CAAX protease family)
VETPTDQNAQFDPNPTGFGLNDAEAAPQVSPAPVAPNPDNPPWGVLLGVGVTLASFFLLLVVQLVLVIPYVLSFHTFDPVEITNIAKSQRAILLSIIGIIPAHLLTLGVAWTVVTGFRKRPFFRTLGWSWSPRLGVWTCLGITLLLLGAAQGLSAIFGDPETDLERMILSSTAARYTIAALATFTAPLVEEVVFRGVLYSGLRKRIGTVWSASVVILIFAAIHVPQYLPNVAAISTILLLSSVLTIVRARTGRLLPCVVIHFFFNGITSILIVLQPFIESKIPPPPTPPTPGALIELCAHVFTKLF